MILMIDNYDSFVYNLVQYLRALNEEVVIVRNDALTIGDIEKLNPEIIVLSPGPRSPKEAGICLEVVEKLKGKYPILGICLGHQTLGMAFGGNIVRASVPVHGKVFPIKHDGKGVFTQLPNPLKVTRYHSLIVERETLPTCLTITAETVEGEIMGLRHNDYLMEGVQFHPEAILTEAGMEILQNFLECARAQKKHDTIIGGALHD